MNPHTEFEQFTQQVYQKLLNNSVLKNIKVLHNVKMKGKSGCEHQIDVYWEYEKDMSLHRVAIECKNYNRHVPIGKVRDFLGVLQDLDNVRGIMVSNKGFQDGAKKFAEHYGISLKELHRPKETDVIGSITVAIHSGVRHCLYLIDEAWISENSFDIERLREFYVRFQPRKTEYWRTATHFPIETKDDIIRDSNGKQISSIGELEKKGSNDMRSNESTVFTFDDAWVISRHWGPIKIREMKFEFENNGRNTTYNLIASDFVEAILEDALNGKTDYVPKY